MAEQTGKLFFPLKCNLLVCAYQSEKPPHSRQLSKNPGVRLSFLQIRVITSMKM